jgi:hypothetical protein
MTSFTNRMIRAAKLDVNLYEEVEADRTIGTTGIMGLVLGTVVALAGWFIWAFLTYYIGTRLLAEPQTKSDYGELLRTIGFSSSPGVLRVLGIIPILGNILNFIIGIWMLVAMIIAVRQALDYKSTWRAVAVFYWLVGGFGPSQA